MFYVLKTCFIACPKYGPGRICHIHQGNLGSVNSSTCECLPGSVEKDGECSLCRGGLSMKKKLNCIKNLVID